MTFIIGRNRFLMTIPLRHQNSLTMARIQALSQRLCLFGQKACRTLGPKRVLTTQKVSFWSKSSPTRGQEVKKILPDQRTATTELHLHRPHNRQTVLFLNSRRLDYDGKLDFTSWYNLCETVVLHPVDALTDPGEMLQLLADYQATIVVAKEMIVPGQVVTKMSGQVQLICEAGTGYNNWPIELARKHGIPVCNIPTYSTEAVAHLAITYMMNFSISMFEQQRMLQRKDHSNFSGPFSLPLRELGSQTLGLIGGSGRIGTRVAEIALALGIQHVYISSRRGILPTDHPLAGHPQVTCTSDVTIVLQQSDYVSLHTPLNDETRASFGQEQLEQMKYNAFLINTSRGAVIAEDELIQALQLGTIAGAGLDVTATEPLAVDSPLWTLPNVWLSPHTGWRRLETRQRLVDMTAENIRSFVKGTTEHDYINVVN